MCGDSAAGNCTAHAGTRQITIVTFLRKTTLYTRNYAYANSNLPSVCSVEPPLQYHSLKNPLVLQSRCHSEPTQRRNTMTTYKQIRNMQQIFLRSLPNNLRGPCNHSSTQSRHSSPGLIAYKIHTFLQLSLPFFIVSGPMHDPYIFVF